MRPWLGPRTAHRIAHVALTLTLALSLSLSLTKPKPNPNPNPNPNFAHRIDHVAHLGGYLGGAAAGLQP